MSVYDNIEEWKDGTLRYVERDNKGRFKKVENKYDDSKTKFYQGQKIGVWNREPQQKIIPEINHKDYVKGDYYRASISLNVGVNSSKNKPNYRNFTYVIVNYKENIDMRDMYEKLIEGIESKDGLHYKRCDFWFEYSYDDCDKQFPKPYYARSESSNFEG
jgi:hypothetical protein